MGGKGSGRKPIFNDEYHRVARERVRKSHAQVKDREQREYAVIEEMTDASYSDMTMRWCVETRMKGDETREQAEEWCRGNPVDGVSVDVEDVLPKFATDNTKSFSTVEKPIHPKIMKQLREADTTVTQDPNAPCNTCHTPSSVSLWVDSDGSRKTICAKCGTIKDATTSTVDGLGIVDRECIEYEKCVSLRMDIHSEDASAARASCDRIMSDPVFRHYWKEELKRQADWKIAQKEISNRYIFDRKLRSRLAIASEYVREHMPRLDVFQELGKRIYIQRHLHGFNEDVARKFVEDDMMREGKLADLNVPKAPGSTVGDLYGKSKQERIREGVDSEDSQLTVGSTYGKTKKQILEEDKKRDY